MLTCREFVDFIGRYLDGEMEAGEKRTFESHVSECPPCLAYLSTYKETVALAAKADPSDELPPDIPEDLIKAVLAARRRG